MMSVQDFYDKRFNFTNSKLDISDAVTQIDIAHTDVSRLLDLIIAIGEESHFDQDHLHAVCRSAISRLAEVDSQLRKVEHFCTTTRINEAAAQPVAAKPPLSDSDDAGLRAHCGPRGGGLSDVIDQRRKSAAEAAETRQVGGGR